MNTEGKRNRITQALVLAAGNGSRLIDSNPKPLYSLLGLPLLARTLFSLEMAGITDAHIVLGYRADEVREEMEKIGRFGIRLHWLENDRWREPNGLSVLTAENVLTEPFILTMCDHIFDPEILSGLQPGPESFEGIKLLVDTDLQNISDLNDATKVKISGGRISRIHKDLTDFNAVDTGFFLAGPVLFQAIRQACGENRCSLSDGVQKLAGKNMVEAVDIQGRLWQDIDTREHVREAERKLLATLGKSSDGPVSRYLNRPISKAVSRLLVRTPVSPNLVSLLNMILGLAAAAFAARGGYLSFLMAALLFQLNSIFDGTDGEMARLTFRMSRSGQWVDTIADNVGYIALILGATIGVKNASLPVFYYYAGIGSLIFGLAAVSSLYVLLLKKKKGGSLLNVKYGFEGWNQRLIRFIYFLGKRDTWALGLVVLALMGWAQGFLVYICGFLCILFLLSLRLHIVSTRSFSIRKHKISYSSD